MRTLYEKIARVRPETKQYRRALQMLEQGDHDWHMTGGMGTEGRSPVLPRILESGSIQPGQNNVITQGVPFNNYGRGRPYNGWFNGGAHVIPSAKHEAAGAIPLGVFGQAGSDYQYAVGSKGTPITRGDTIIHDSANARARLPRQSELKFRPIHRDAYERAHRDHRGRAISVNAAMTKKPGVTLKVPEFPNWAEIAHGPRPTDGARVAPPLSSSSLFPAALMNPKHPGALGAPPQSEGAAPGAAQMPQAAKPKVPMPPRRAGGLNVLKRLGFR